jgi:cell division septation protein DedD
MTKTQKATILNLKEEADIKTTSSVYLDYLVNQGDTEILIDLLRNPQLSKKHLTKLTEHSNSQIAKEAKLHINWDEEIENSEEFVQKAIRESFLSIETRKEDIFTFLSVEMIPEKWLGSLIIGFIGSNHNVRRKVASNPHTPVSVLEKLATDSDYNIRSNVASNPHTLVTLLEKLATDSDNSVRCNVASNPNTSVSVLEKLATDPYNYVRCNVASNPHTPVTSLEKLATDSDNSVRFNVARNPNTPVSVLEKLATDSDNWVRRNLASNPNTPVSVLEKLASDSVWEVRRNVASNPNTSVSVLEKLATDSNDNVRRNVASNPNTSVSVLEKLATDSNDNVRRNVVLNPNTPVSALEKLAKDYNYAIRLCLLKNNNIPPNLLKQFKTSEFATLMKNKKPNLGRLTLLFSGYAKTSHLAKNCRSTNWLERYAIAQNPNTPDHILNYLLKDGNKLVRDAVKNNIQQKQGVK